MIDLDIKYPFRNLMTRAVSLIFNFIRDRDIEIKVHLTCQILLSEFTEFMRRFKL